MSIVSVDNISPIGSGTSVTVNSAATLVLNNANSTGVITATSFVGSGANLTSLPAANLTGTLPAIDGSNLTGISGVTINNNADNRIITGSGTAATLNAESGVTIDGSNILALLGSGQQQLNVGSTNAGGAAIILDGDSNGDGAGGDYSLIRHNTDGDLEFYARSTGGATNTIFKQGTSEKLRVQSGGGISFNGDTAAANALDDYEEGSFTPTTSGFTNTHNPNGRYVKIGNHVFLSMVFTRSGSTNFTMAGGDNGVIITNLPFTNGNFGGVGQVIMPQLSNIGSTNGNGATLFVEPGQAKIYVSGAGITTPRCNMSVFYSVS